jgi:hypothetical protein
MATNTENTENTVNTENVSADAGEVVRVTRKGVPLGNRFAALPVLGDENSPFGDRAAVMTLKEVAEYASRSRVTATKYLANAGVEAVCLIPTGSVGRPAPAYLREDVEAAISAASGVTDAQEAADSFMQEADAALESHGSLGE